MKQKWKDYIQDKHYNAAKVTPAQVQNIRDLYRAGFNFKSLAETFNVCHRTIRDIIYGRSWRFLVDDPQPLPIFHSDTARRLRLRSAKKITKAMQRELERYHHELAKHQEAQAQREGLALLMMSDWTTRSPRRNRKASGLRGLTLNTQEEHHDRAT
jgi:hypothetical protein